MKVERIEEGNKTLAIVVRNEDWEHGLSFVSSSEDYLQVGTWWYSKGQKLLPHIHLNAPREILSTQEMVLIKEGCIRADIYNEEGLYLKSVELKKGDFIVLLKGGHGYEILEEDTKVLEVKNGPYVGVEKNRKRI
jgi:hypothetical protein